MPVVFEDLREIFEYISKHTLDKAHGVLDRIQDAFELLATHPHAGPHRDGFGEGRFRSYLVDGFLITYTPGPRVVHIHRVVSGYRDLTRLRL